MRLVLALVLIAVLWMPHPTAAVDDAELINQLVAGSPWKGENIGDRGRGSVTYDVMLSKDSSGALTGVVSNYSIPAFASIAKHGDEAAQPTRDSTADPPEVSDLPTLVPDRVLLGLFRQGGGPFVG